MGIHFPGLRNINRPVVWVFPELTVCLDCGQAEFAVPEPELRQLASPSDGVSNEQTRSVEI